MTLQLLHSEFPYVSGKFDFLFYQCVACPFYLGRARSEAVDNVGAGLGTQHTVPDGRHRKVQQEEH